MERIYYSYGEFLTDSKTLLSQIQKYNPDVIVVIARGGMCLGHLLAQGLNLRDIYTINSVLYEDTSKNDKQQIFNIPNLTKYKRLLVVDDIVDSGETAFNVIKILKNKFFNLDIKLASIFYKRSAIINPDFKVQEATKWVDFFWEVDLKS